MDSWLLALLSPQRRLHRSWRAAVEALELSASPTVRTPVRFVGEPDAVPFELLHEPASWPLSSGTTVIRARSSLPLSCELVLRPSQGQRCGDANFDAQVRIEGDPLLAASLGPRQRADLMRHLRRQPGRHQVVDGWLCTRTVGQARDASTLVRTARRLVKLAQALDDQRTPLERLAARLHSEPSWQTRRFVVQALADHGGPATQALLQPALHDPNGAVRNAAARLLGLPVHDDSGALTLSVSQGSLSLLDEE